MPQPRIDALPLRTRRSPMARLTLAFTQALARHRTRQSLARLDAHLLRDIGLDATSVAEECAKPIWRP